jgi:hypothetical protein
LLNTWAKNPFCTFVVVLVSNFPKLTKTILFTEVLVFAERPVGSYGPILFFFYLGSSFVKVIQELKHQRQHFKPLLKITEKLTLFSPWLFFMSDSVHS